MTENPKGIPPRSPGLRAASYPGKIGWWRLTPTGCGPDRGVGTQSLGLKIARTPTQGSCGLGNPGLEDTIPLGLQNHRSFRRSVRQWPRTEYPKGIGHSRPLPELSPPRSGQECRGLLSHFKSSHLPFPNVSDTGVKAENMTTSLLCTAEDKRLAVADS